MPSPIPSSITLVSARDADPLAQAQMAAAAYLARYSGRTLETYRYDLLTFFQWCTDVGLDVLEATLRAEPNEPDWRSSCRRTGHPRTTLDVCLSATMSCQRVGLFPGSSQWAIPHTTQSLSLEVHR